VVQLYICLINNLAMNT